MTTQLGNVPTSGVRSLRCDDRGLSTVEYVIILVLIAVSAIGVWTTFGNTLKGKIKSAHEEVRGLGSNGNMQ